MSLLVLSIITINAVIVVETIVSTLAIMLLQFQQALERVRAGADVMPQGQLQKVIAAELGPDWRTKMATFEDDPLAAASIGQVCFLFSQMCFWNRTNILVWPEGLPFLPKTSSYFA